MRYPSKLLLFGEHTINQGSQALAIPYPHFGGTWAYATNAHHRQQHLQAFAKWLEDWPVHGESSKAVDLQRFKEELNQGLYFDSNIPSGYGLGSSGAVCAAIYDRFGPARSIPTDALQMAALRQTLAQLERYFHGSSSGTDPLVCYLAQPIRLYPNGGAELVSIPKHSPLVFFLLDTHIPRQTGPLVQFFLERCKQAAFAEQVRTVWSASADQAISAFLNEDWEDLFEAVARISRVQLAFFADMIPTPFHQVWEVGLQHDLYRLKLCGAGGGGFILGCTFDWPTTREALFAYHCRKAYPMDDVML